MRESDQKVDQKLVDLKSDEDNESNDKQDIEEEEAIDSGYESPSFTESSSGDESAEWFSDSDNTHSESKNSDENNIDLNK